MWAVIGTLLLLVSNGLTYWISTAGDRKRKQQLARKQEIENELAEAIRSRNAARIAAARERMQRFADEAGYLL